jgi:aspartate kinase
MKKIVCKFGGTQLKDAESIRRAYDVIKGIYEKENPELVLMVVSAPGKIGERLEDSKETDLLENVWRKKDKKSLEIVLDRNAKTAKEVGVDNSALDRLKSELIQNYETNTSSPADYSRIVGAGERMQSLIIGKAFGCKHFDYNEFGMLTEGNYKESSALEEALVEIEKSLSHQKGIVIIPGFVGYNKKGEITTLGRDGSNYTATKIAEAIGAEEVRIFSDEPGVRRASPLFVPDAEIISELTYEEAREFAELGAKIINPKAIGPARKENIPIYILNETGKGTKISSSISMEHMGAKIIASVPDHYILTVKYNEDKVGILSKIALAFDHSGINIESMADEKHAASFAFLPNARVGEVIGTLKDSTINLENKIARISLIGEGMREQVGVIERIAGVYRKGGISFEMISQAMSQLNVSTFIKGEYERIAVQGLYDSFFRNNHSEKRG